MQIKILSAGCKKCSDLDEKFREVALKNNIEVEVIKITDWEEIAKYGVLATPGIVINEKIKSIGQVPGELQILNWLKEG